MPNKKKRKGGMKGQNRTTFSLRTLFIPAYETLSNLVYSIALLSLYALLAILIKLT